MRITTFKTVLALMLAQLALTACSDSKASPTAAKTSTKANVGQQPPATSARTDSLTIATLNMCVGWQAEDLVVQKLSDSNVVYKAMADLYVQYKQSLPSIRMMIQAEMIMQHPADVVALQETQTMFAGDTESFSFVDTLLADLKAIGGPTDWTVVRQTLNQITLNVPDSAGDRMKLNFWEGNVFLVRSKLAVLDSTTAIYNEAVNLSILSQPVGSHRGYTQIRVQTPGGAIWQLFTTHLEVNLLSAYNLEQGQELNAAAWNAWQSLDSGTQVVLGDMNSKPGTGGVSALTGKTSGLVDLGKLTWSSSADSAASFSCCIGDLQNSALNYDQRIDYILSRNFLKLVRMERVSMLQAGDWASDHAMLRATLTQQF